jgi:hypothetical protein
LRLGEKFLVRILGGALQGVSNSSVQMPSRSGSPQGVFCAIAEPGEAWADAGMTDAEKSAPRVAAAMAAVIIEPEKRSRMTISFLRCSGLLQ